jgi:hypothetical protein
MRIPRLGDLVRMPLPDQPSPDYVQPFPQTFIPSLPPDLAAEFASTMTAQGTIPAYAADTDTPPLDYSVQGGPYFVGALPGGGIPVTGLLPGQSQPAFQRAPIIPDSELPFVLKRTGVLGQGPNLFNYTRSDAEIAHEAALWQWIAKHGGLKSCCRIPELGAPLYSYPPWQVMPSNAIRFGPNNIYYQPVTAFGPPFTGVDVVLGEFQCDLGYDGAITHFLCGYTGSGHEDGSGDIVWRLKIGQRFAKDVGNVQTTFGSIQTALTIPGSAYRFISGQTVQLIANVPVGSPIDGGRIFAGVLGWMYPRR